MRRAAAPLAYTAPVGREVVTAPTAELLTLDEVRMRLRIPYQDEDVDLQAMLYGATEMLEASLGRSLRAATVRWWYDDVPRGRTVWFPEPVRAVASVTTYDTSGASAVVSAALYEVDTRHHRLVVRETADWPPSDLRATNALAIEATVGYAAPTDVPFDLREALLLQVMALYQRDTLKAPEQAAYQQAIGRTVGKHAFRVGVA